MSRALARICEHLGDPLVRAGRKLIYFVTVFLDSEQEARAAIGQIKAAKLRPTP
jgi:hypothetical protein